MCSLHLGQTDIGGRANVKQTTLVISPVKEEDAGQFTCIADNVPHEHTLFLVSGKQQSQDHLYLQIIFKLHQTLQLGF